MSFDFEVVSTDQAEEKLRELRSNRGGRGPSKYQSIGEEVQDLKKDQVLRVKLEKHEVGGLRGYLNRYYPDQYTVKSSKTDDDSEYMAFVFRS